MPYGRMSNVTNIVSYADALADDLASAEFDSFSSDVEPTNDHINRIHKNVLNRTLEMEVEEAFNLFDSDRNNKIDFFECQAAFRALRLNSSKDAIKDMFKELGKDETCVLTMTDFKTLVIAQIHTRYTSGEAKKIFAQLEDGSGRITLMSLRNVVDQLGAKVTADELSLMISEASKGKDFVNFEDFRKLLKRSWTGDPLDAIFEADDDSSK